MKIDYSELGKFEQDFITALEKHINEKGSEIMRINPHRREDGSMCGIEMLLLDVENNRVPLMLYTNNPAFYEALAKIDNSFLPYENPKYKGMNKHLVFIHKLAELGFYVYRAYKKDKLETTISVSGVNGGYLIALQHPNLSPIHYEIPKDEIKEECLTSLVYLRAKTEEQ